MGFQFTEDQRQILIKLRDECAERSRRLEEMALQFRQSNNSQTKDIVVEEENNNSVESVDGKSLSEDEEDSTESVWVNDLISESVETTANSGIEEEEEFEFLIPPYFFEEMDYSTIIEIPSYFLEEKVDSPGLNPQFHEISETRVQSVFQFKDSTKTVEGFTVIRQVRIGKEYLNLLFDYTRMLFDRDKNEVVSSNSYVNLFRLVIPSSGYEPNLRFIHSIGFLCDNFAGIFDNCNMFVKMPERVVRSLKAAVQFYPYFVHNYSEFDRGRECQLVEGMEWLVAVSDVLNIATAKVGRVGRAHVCQSGICSFLHSLLLTSGHLTCGSQVMSMYTFEYLGWKFKLPSIWQARRCVDEFLILEDKDNLMGLVLSCIPTLWLAYRKWKYKLRSTGLWSIGNASWIGIFFITGECFCTNREHETYLLWVSENTSCSFLTTAAAFTLPTSSTCVRMIYADSLNDGTIITLVVVVEVSILTVWLDYLKWKFKLLYICLWGLWMRGVEGEKPYKLFHHELDTWGEESFLLQPYKILILHIYKQLLVPCKCQLNWDPGIWIGVSGTRLIFLASSPTQVMSPSGIRYAAALLVFTMAAHFYLRKVVYRQLKISCAKKRKKGII